MLGRHRHRGRYEVVCAVGMMLVLGVGGVEAQDVSGTSASSQTQAPAISEGPTGIRPLFFEVFVTAPSRMKEEIGKTPQAVSVVTREALHRRQARTPNQMLREEPGIWSAQVSAQGSPIIRGLIGNRVLYLWDGVRINNGALFSGPNGFFNQFPIGGVERIEVLRGPGAVQYGSDAIGGVINIVQRTADLFSPTMQAGGDLTMRYGSVDTERTGYANAWVASDRVSLSLGTTGQTVGDYKMPGGVVQRYTGFDSVGGYAALALRLRPQESLKVSWVQDRRSHIGTYTQSKLNPSGIPRITSPFEDRGIARIDYQSERASSAIQGIHVYGYHQYYASARDTTVETSTVFNRTRTDTKQGVTGVGGQAAAVLGPHRLVFGVDARSEDLDSGRMLYTRSKAAGTETSRIPNGSVPPGTYSVADAFALLKVAVTPRLSWSAGGRFETAKLHSNPRPQDALTPFTVADLTLDRRWSAVTWSTGAVYEVAGGWSVVGNIAAGFRAPTFSDTLSTGVPVFASAVASVPSPNVDPEHSITYEAGPRYASEHVNLSVTVYSNQLTDQLTSVTIGTIDVPGVGVVAARQNANIASAYIRGVEAAFAWRIARPLTVIGNATVTRGEDTFNHDPLRFIPPANGMLGLVYTHPSNRWWVESSTVIADRLRRHAPGDELDAGFSIDPGFGSPSKTNPPLPGFVIPGFTVTNLRVGGTLWQGDRGGRRRVEVTLDLANLFNERYREAYSQQQLYAPMFGAVLGTTVRF